MSVDISSSTVCVEVDDAPMTKSITTVEVPPTSAIERPREELIEAAANLEIYQSIDCIPDDPDNMAITVNPDAKSLTGYDEMFEAAPGLSPPVATEEIITQVTSVESEGAEWGEFESNCCVTPGESAAETHAQERVSMTEPALGITTTSHTEPKPIQTEEVSGTDATGDDMGGAATGNGGVKVPTPVKESERSLDTPVKHEKQRNKRVQFGEDRVAVYDTTSSPIHHVLDESKLPDSKTKLTYNDGSIYEGDSVHGRRHGQGICTYTQNSIVYNGEWKDDMKHGHGKITYADGTIYEGGFKFGRKDGDGTLYYSSGGLYVGKFRDNKKNGRGKYVAPNGDLYVGGWKDGAMHGQGLWQGVSGDWYEGEFRSGQRDGQGVFCTTAGDRYIGEWAGGCRNGQGRQSRADGGYVYEGGFAEDMKHGNGLLIFEEDDGTDRVVYEGVWEDDELVSSASSCTLS